MKPVIDLTSGGSCDGCDTEKVCSVCQTPMTEQVMLYYMPSGDHDHLVMRDGRLGREGHGRLGCMEHYKADWINTYPGATWPSELDTPTQSP